SRRRRHVVFHLWTRALRQTRLRAPRVCRGTDPDSFLLLHFVDRGRRVPLGRVVASEVLLRIRTPDLRMRDDAIAPEAAKVLEPATAAFGVALEKCLEARRQLLDHVRANRV